MGVTGLWRLIEPAGKPVPVETLENKVIAVDISIWLHQMVKGYQDTKGAPIPNAHLMGLFQRLCKLLYFRIKPVFVFDGAFPDLKKETIAKRQFNKSKYNSESERLKRELALLLSKKSAISSLLGKDISPKKATSSEPNNDDIFKLPALPVSKNETESESDDEQNSSGSVVDLHSVDIESDKFKNLPVKDKYELLIELKETRKQNSWGRLHELPKKSDNFSDFQLERLLKRRKVQECLQETEKEMGDGGMSIVELESILNEEGIDTKIESIPTRRIASNNTTRFLLINNVKQALAEAKKKKDLENNPGTSKHIETPISETQPVKKDEPEDDLELAIKMSMECADDEDTTETEKQTAKKDELENDLEKAIKLSLGYEDPDISNYASKTDDSWTSIMTDSDNTDGTDSEEENGFEQSDLSSAKAYIMQYSDFTNKAIDKIVSSKRNAVKKKPMLCQIDEILDEINNEKSVIVENIDLSSDEDCETEGIDTRDHDTVIENVTGIDATQSSVICVENPVQEIVSLDTSIEENSEDSNLKSCLERAMSCGLTKTEKKLDTSLYRGVNNAKTIEPMIIPNEKLASVDSDSSQIKIESSSSDDEFEDVPDIESESKKTVVQLILDMDQGCNESDDIFADVFTTKEMRNYANESTKIETKISSETTKVSQSHSNKSNILQEINKFSETKKNVSSERKKEPTVKKDNNNDSLLGEINKKLEISLKNQLIVIKDNELNSNLTVLEDVKNRLDENILNTREVSKECKVDSSDINEMKKSNFRDLTQGSISTERLNEMAEKVASKEQELIQEKGRLDRIGRNITEQMTKEAQELLQIFGIPYIVAPMEAEAQCAFLESANLTDGTITDDSDIWLFGGKTVYKNFFNQKKHVLQFLSERIEKSFNLTREQLVLLALLVGSDYTTGVDGVGPVTAMEILASFPYNKQFLNETSKQGRYQQIITGLEEFKKWVRAGRRTDNTTLKKKLRNVSLTDDFPSIRVIQAYMEPNVENSKEKFTWGEMDITILRDYTKAKFGWSQSKLDEIINPVLKRVQERKSQKTVQDYFKRKVVFQPLDEQMSKRVKAAVQRMGPDNVLIDEDAIVESEEPIPTKKRKTNSKSKTGAAKSVVKPTLVAGLSKISNDMTCPNATVVSSIINSKTSADIVIPKTERFQELIPQREKDKQCLLQNKMKAIELFRKTKIDRKKKFSKRKAILPKEKAELSESSDGD